MSQLDQFPAGTMVGIYNRVSTEKRVQLNALATQVEETRRVVLEANLCIYEQYIEPESGTETEHRKEFLRMKEDLSKGKFQILVAKCQDRICRDQAEWHNLVKLCLKKHVTIYFSMPDTIYNHRKDDISYSLQALIDAEYSRQISDKIRQKHRMRQLYEKGTKALNISRPIYGWDRNVEWKNEHIKNVWYSVNEKEAANILEVIKLLYEGNSFYKIAEIMYQKGVKSKETFGAKNLKPHRISETSWRKMIENPLLHGEAVLGRYSKDFYTKERIENPREEWIHVENAIEPILSKEEHEKILEFLETHKRQKKESSKNKYR